MSSVLDILFKGFTTFNQFSKFEVFAKFLEQLFR